MAWENYMHRCWLSLSEGKAGASPASFGPVAEPGM